jgi:hypothetical protein
MRRNIDEAMIWERKTLGALCAGSWRLNEDLEGAGANEAALSINRTGNGRVARPQ